MIIYLTGIDGSGKSTITEKLVTEVFTDKDVKTIWARYKPNFVKLLISPFKKKFVVDKENNHLMDDVEYSDWSRYKRRITKSWWLSQLFFILQSTDYLIQLVKYNSTFINHENKLLIIDRYLLDFIVDQSVNYGDIENNIITKYLLRKLGKLDMIFFIDTPEEIAFSRKDDIPSIEYLKERRNYYLHYVAKLKNVHIINNSNLLSDTIEEIAAVVATKY